MVMLDGRTQQNEVNLIVAIQDFSNSFFLKGIISYSFHFYRLYAVLDVVVFFIFVLLVMYATDLF